MTNSNWIYIISIALQMNGGILLLFTQLTKSWAEKDKGEEYYPPHVEDETYYVGDYKEKPKQRKRIILRYWITFLSILVGYTLAVFGDIGSAKKGGIVLLILICTALFSSISIALTWPRNDDTSIQQSSGDEKTE